MWISKKKWKQKNDELEHASIRITNLERNLAEAKQMYESIVYLYKTAEPKIEPCISLNCANCKYAVIEQHWDWRELQGCGRNRICEHFEPKGDVN